MLKFNKNSISDILTDKSSAAQGKFEKIKSAFGQDRNMFALRKISLAVGVLLLSFVAVFVFFHRGDLANLRLFCKPNPTISLSGAKVSRGNFQENDATMTILSDSFFLRSDRYCRETATFPHDFQSPMLKAGEKYALIYDLLGKGAKVISGTKILHEKAFEDSICAGDISGTGVFALVTQGPSGVNKLNVFHKDGQNSLFDHSFKGEHVMAVALSQNGKSAATAGLFSKEGKFVSQVSIFEFSKEAPKFTLDYTGSAFLLLKFVSNRRLVAVGDNLVSFVNAENGQRSDFIYDGRNLVAFSISESGDVALVLSPTKNANDCTVFLFDQNGKMEQKFKTDLCVRSVAYKGSRLAVLGDGTVRIYNENGDKLYQIAAGDNPQKILFLGIKKLAVLYPAQLKILNF